MAQTKHMLALLMIRMRVTLALLTVLTLPLLPFSTLDVFVLLTDLTRSVELTFVAKDM